MSQSVSLAQFCGRSPSIASVTYLTPFQTAPISPNPPNIPFYLNLPKNRQALSTSISPPDSIIDQITRLFIAPDNRAWDTIQNIFAEKVLLDYSSMGGGEPASLSAGQIVDAWKQLLPGFDATHH